jgi:hypothetical protein
MIAEKADAPQSADPRHTVEQQVDLPEPDRKVR